MGIKVDDFKVVYESVTMEAIEPEYLGITKEQILEYLKEHPMPLDLAYSEEEMINDITGSTGFYHLPMAIKEETANFIATILSDLI